MGYGLPGLWECTGIQEFSTLLLCDAVVLQSLTPWTSACHTFLSKGRKRTMEQSVTNPSVRSLLWLFLQPLCPLSVSINDTVQLNLALVVHRDSFHTKMQFSPRVSALPNGLHRISWMVSGWFLGDKLITMAIIRGSHPIAGQGKNPQCHGGGRPDYFRKAASLE